MKTKSILVGVWLVGLIVFAVGLTVEKDVVAYIGAGLLFIGMFGFRD